MPNVKNETSRTNRVLARWFEPEGREYNPKHLELLYQVMDASTSGDLDFGSFTEEDLVCAARMVEPEESYRPENGDDNPFFETWEIRDAVMLFEGFLPTLRVYDDFI